jgi:phenylalanyl-tRNA synthetase beta chain
MKVSVNWVNNCSNNQIVDDIEEIAQKIGAQLGAIEQVTNLNQQYKGALIVKVINCQKHPNADKLNLCLIDDAGQAKDVERNQDGYVQVVCGAPNIATGQTVVWLPPGSAVPASFNDDEPFVLGKRELRGALSNGMIASPKELAIGDDHDGILVLSDEYNTGSDFAKTFGLNDYIIDLENKMFTHRPDCFGILGVARELAGIKGNAFASPDWYVNEPKLADVAELGLSVEVKTNLVPRFCAITVNNISVKPSPLAIQADLSKVGIRPINNIVDITNWLMHLTGQPLHAYDYDKVAKLNGGKANLTATLSSSGQELKLLNGKTIKFNGDDTVLICAGNTPIGIGGVMGGADTEVDHNTKNIIIECATFDMYNIRRTSMKYGLFSDAVTRFNKGQSPLQNAKIIAKALAMVIDLAGGKQASNLYDYKLPNVATKPNVKVTANFINERLGSDFSAQQMAKTLSLVEFKVNVKGDELDIKVPFWRQDIKIAEDIIEEVGRLSDFAKLPVNLPLKSIKPSTNNSLIEFKYLVSDILNSAGANEVLTYSFVHGDIINKAGQDISQAYKLTNAISPDLQYYRLSLSPSLLDKIHGNIKAGYNELAIYELGKAHNKKWVEENLPLESQRLAFVYAVGDKLAKIRQGQAYYYAKNYLSFLLDKLNIKLVYNKFDDIPASIADSSITKPFLPTRSAILTTIDGDNIGVVGEYLYPVLQGFKLPQYCAGFELDIAKLQQLYNKQTNYQRISKYPKVSQDISLQTANNINYASIHKCLQDSLRANRPDDSYAFIEPLDIYNHQDVINYTFRLIITSYSQTLKASQVNSLLDQVASDCHKRFGAKRI